MVIILAALFAPTFWMLVLIMAIFQWISITFYMRTEMYREKTREYCLAAKSYGASHWRIVFRHLLPNCLTPLVTFTPFAVVGAIFALTGLDYLGYGLPAPTPSWGEMMDQALEPDNRDKLWLTLRAIRRDHYSRWCWWCSSANRYAKPSIRNNMRNMSSPVMAGLDPATRWRRVRAAEKTHMPKTYFVYIMASQRNGTLYIGVTNDIIRRAWEHREGLVPGFTKKYGVKMLVWFEESGDIGMAIQRETSPKRWNRKWKLDLVEQMNPDWLDLYERVCQ